MGPDVHNPMLLHQSWEPVGTGWARAGRGLPGLAMAWLGTARHGAAKPGLARRGVAGQGLQVQRGWRTALFPVHLHRTQALAWPGRAWPGLARQGKAGRGVPGLGLAGQGLRTQRAMDSDVHSPMQLQVLGAWAPLRRLLPSTFDPKGKRR